MSPSSPGVNWRPGHRRVPPGQNGRFGRTVRALALLWDYKITLRHNPVHEKLTDSLISDGLETDSFGDNITLNIQFGASQAVTLHLSTMTMRELETLKEIFMEAYDAAFPVAAQRDLIAKEAADGGNDNFRRRHRQDPKISRF